MTRKICLVGGGTGGHLVPNFAMYKALVERENNPYFYTPNNEFDKRFCSSKGVHARTLKFGKLASGGVFSVITKVLFSVIEVGIHFLLERPYRVVGTGGYGSFPMYLWAVILRIPLFIVEPNQVCGKVNRWFAPYARKVFTISDNVGGLENQHNLFISGNPLPYEMIADRYSKPVLLTFGASQGASVINEFMANWLGQLKEPLPFEVIWITGSKEFAKYSAMHVSDGIEILGFHEDMEQLYRKASLIICRAGAGTISELKVFRVPAILVPYPHHADRQQYLNSEELVKAKACLLVEESRFKFDEIEKTVSHLLNSPETLFKMQDNFPMSPDPVEIRRLVADIILQN